MAAKVNIRPKVDKSAVNDFLERPAQVKLLEVVAREIVDIGEVIAPEGTGYYKTQFQARPFRRWWRAQNNDPFAHLVEWGSVNNRAYAPMRTAIRAAGVAFKPGPKG